MKDSHLWKCLQHLLGWGNLHHCLLLFIYALRHILLARLDYQPRKKGNYPMTPDPHTPRDSKAPFSLFYQLKFGKLWLISFFFKKNCLHDKITMHTVSKSSLNTLFILVHIIVTWCIQLNKDGFNQITIEHRRRYGLWAYNKAVMYSLVQLIFVQGPLTGQSGHAS